MGLGSAVRSCTGTQAALERLFMPERTGARRAPGSVADRGTRGRQLLLAENLRLCAVTHVDKGVEM